MCVIAKRSSTMKTKLYRFYAFFYVFFVLALLCQAQAQNVSIELGPNEIGINEQFTITVKVEEDRLERYGDFPDIPGFEKAGTSTSSSTNIINGKISSSQSVTQSYIPTREGTFQLAPFQIAINDKQVSSSGTKIKVGPAKQRRSSNNPFDFNDPFEDFFGGRNQPDEFEDVEEDAFLALTTSKDTVYLGEGFTTTLAFYVSEKNQAPLQFYDLGKQLTDILKDIKPTAAWEENFNIENINGTPVTINGENYTQYKIYQAAYYPFNLNKITFPSLPLQMIKYKVAKNPSFFGRRRQEDFKTFYSQPKQVVVKDLPPHPYKEQVAVGDYHLEENISQTSLETGNSFNYTFKVVGEGNISAINKPTIRQIKGLDVYAPSIEQNISRRNNRVRGSKAFSYYAVPSEPGSYQLSDYIHWIFFNTATEQYDTLTSDITVEVEGRSLKNESISSRDVGSFYDQLADADNSLRSRNNDGWLQLVANILILSMLLMTIVLVFKR